MINFAVVSSKLCKFCSRFEATRGARAAIVVQWSRAIYMMTITTPLRETRAKALALINPELDKAIKSLET